MPAYTKNGYVVMKIPSQLYELINEAKAESKIVTEECNEVHQNCARVKTDGTYMNMFLFLTRQSLWRVLSPSFLLSFFPILLLLLHSSFFGILPISPFYSLLP